MKFQPLKSWMIQHNQYEKNEFVGIKFMLGYIARNACTYPMGKR